MSATRHVVILLVGLTLAASVFAETSAPESINAQDFHTVIWTATTRDGSSTASAD